MKRYDNNDNIDKITISTYKSALYVLKMGQHGPCTA